ncbi:MAG: ATP-binding cassette domain-containing protein, partial [Ensifer adhaerens]
MSDALLEIRNLNVDYLLDDGAFRAVNDVSFEVRRGELFGLAGESGCGKSTIAYAITRLSKPPAWVAGGEILLDGQNLLKMPEASLQNVRWRRIGMVFQ